jgi:hypothetical protein
VDVHPRQAVIDAVVEGHELRVVGARQRARLVGVVLIQLADRVIAGRRARGRGGDERQRDGGGGGQTLETARQSRAAIDDDVHFILLSRY